jgi:hypothetical protein
LVGSSDCKSKFLSTFLYRSSKSNSKKNKKGYDVPRFDNFQHGLDVSYIESIRVHLDTHCRPIHESSFFFSFLFFFRVSYPQSRKFIETEGKLPVKTK